MELHSPVAPHNPVAARHSWAAVHHSWAVPHRPRHRHLPVGHSPQGEGHSHSWAAGHSLEVELHRRLGNRCRDRMADSHWAADSLEVAHRRHRHSPLVGDNLGGRQKPLGLPWRSGNDTSKSNQECILAVHCLEKKKLISRLKSMVTLSAQSICSPCQVCTRTFLLMFFWVGQNWLILKTAAGHPTCMYVLCDYHPNT